MIFTWLRNLQELGAKVRYVSRSSFKNGPHDSVRHTFEVKLDPEALKRSFPYKKSSHPLHAVQDAHTLADVLDHLQAYVEKENLSRPHNNQVNWRSTAKHSSAAKTYSFSFPQSDPVFEQKVRRLFGEPRNERTDHD